MESESTIRLVTEIMGMKIITPEGENIGVVQNVMIDPTKDIIIYIVLCYANFLGKTHRYFAISNHFLRSSPHSEATLVLDIDRQTLLHAPSLSQKTLTDVDHIYEISTPGAEIFA